ncbi:MAG: hypothetical protein ABI478_12855 [Propionivibrio sp.]
MRIFRHGNTAALIVGIALMLADNVIPFANEFGAWPIGCLLAVWYSASAIRENERFSKKMKRWSYIYLAIVFVVFVSFRDLLEAPVRKMDWSTHSALKSLGVDKR